MYFILSGEPPFDGEDLDQLFENIKKGKFNFERAAFKNVSKDAKDLIK